MHPENERFRTGMILSDITGKNSRISLKDCICLNIFSAEDISSGNPFAYPAGELIIEAA